MRNYLDWGLEWPCDLDCAGSGFLIGISPYYYFLRPWLLFWRKQEAELKIRPLPHLVLDYASHLSLSSVPAVECWTVWIACRRPVWWVWLYPERFILCLAAPALPITAPISLPWGFCGTTPKLKTCFHYNQLSFTSPFASLLMFSYRLALKKVAYLNWDLQTLPNMPRWDHEIFQVALQHRVCYCCGWG